MQMRKSIFEPVLHELTRISGTAAMSGFQDEAALEAFVNEAGFLERTWPASIPIVLIESNGKGVTTSVFTCIARMAAVLGK